MFRKLVLALVCVLFIGTLAGCSGKDNKTENSSDKGKVQVVVSFNPLKEFTEAVGKDKVNVISIVPDGMEAHDFELKAKDMEKIREAKIFVYNGLGMESWVEDTLQVIDNRDLIIVDSSKNVNAIKMQEDDHEEDEEDDEHEHGEFDPHIWLSLKEAKVQALNIKDALVQADQANEGFYQKNYEEFAGKLDELYNEYAEKFQEVQNKHFVTGHAAFAYLCRDFGLEQNSVEDVFAEGEPTPKRLQELTEYCKQNNIKVVFMEELASPKVSETLANEVGAKVQTIYTIESKQDGKDYLQSMRENLENIYTSIK
ncbi:metal ABC transporter substrate-binding protein [Clostridium thermarum]|uniref:metal ABC transporter substrate-binding protein n=1 Tax=Clostridium thermarum TaxID=1716543 RepID=UPI001121CD78|nr:metal ABC transporter substrate-binding protein [Clostridium thermarum]